jgi:hypothetical protein
VVTFQSEPVQKAGITGGSWDVSGNVLPGSGPIRTLRISAYSNDFTPLSGAPGDDAKHYQERDLKRALQQINK